MFKNLHNLKYNKGVTLVELLVVIFIFVVISGITIFDYGKFRSSLSLQNLADDIALSVRKAQGYAIGVHSSGTNFNVGYGVHFTTNPIASDYSGSNKSFILFTDVDAAQNKMYEYSSTCGGIPSNNNECLEQLNISGADTVSGIKVNGGPSGTGTIDIVFKRPDPEPKFCYKTSQALTSCTTSGTIADVEIILSSVNGSTTTTKTVKIANNGQISVSN